MPRITPFLWFHDQAEEAMRFYVSVFKNSKVGHVTPGPNGKAMSVTFQLEGQDFMALNAGPQFAFTEAISFFVSCETQADVDELWTRLTEGGEPGRCGWLKDKFGLSWQIIPTVLGRMMGDPDRTRAERVVQAMMQMSKLDISKLQQAYDRAIS